jgi:phosphoribosylaminoimidazolecarboxamide formyltransferase/IMP cyclohydrolase
MISHIDSWHNLEKVSGGKDPTPDELNAALFNWPVALYAKSNGISIGSQYRTFGIGSGQGSRVDSTWLAIHYANNRCEGSNARGAVMASDAFFPESDSVRLAGEAGVAAIVFPLGSIKDAESLALAEKYGMIMLCTRPIPGEKKIERGFNH